MTTDCPKDFYGPYLRIFVDVGTRGHYYYVCPSCGRWTGAYRSNHPPSAEPRSAYFYSKKRGRFEFACRRHLTQGTHDDYSRCTPRA